MKSFFGIRPLALVLAFWFLNSMEGLHAAHKAFVFSTDGALVPVVLTDTIKARFGNDTVIQVINPGAASTINGVTVKDMGAVAMPRSDNASAPAGMARHFAFLGDFTLQAGQSIWGWGDLLLKLEILGNASFEAGTVVNVSALGKLGGAGGGDGGTPTASPFNDPTYTAINSEIVSVNPFNRGTATKTSIKGDEGYRTGFYSSGMIPESVYARSVMGGTGVSGQGDRYYLSGGTLSGQATGGASAPSSGIIAAAGTGGARGRHASEIPFGNGFGENGGNGTNGQDGPPGTSGADGRLETLAGTARHLRGGSGGGAGATGGWGSSGATAGAGGGGGAGGGNPQANGGNGGWQRDFGDGGRPGVGGTGGGGGGGVLVLVRGLFVDSALWEAEGGNGNPGTAGEAGTAGSAGEAGQSGQSIDFGGKGGDGGKAGKSGNGGKGGDGGKGASGSGGNIQIAASNYYGSAATFDTSGGSGAPAGLAQHDHFNEGTVNAPFSLSASEPNYYRSFVDSMSHPIPPAPTVPVNNTPMLPLLTGGPASYGIQENVDFTLNAIISKLNPPPDCSAVVVRLEPSDFFTLYDNYDVLAYVNVRPGSTLSSPKLGAVSPADTAAASTPFALVYEPTPLPLLQNKGYVNDPLYNPSGTGAATANPTYGQIWLTTVEKGKSFGVTAQWTPYAASRTIRGTPIRGRVNTAGQIPQNALYLIDKGNPDLVIEQISEYSVNSAPIMLETPGDRTVTHYARVGTSPTYRYKMGSSFGNPNTKTGGFASCDYYRADGSFVLGETRSYSNRSNTDPAVTMEVTVPTLGRAFLSEALLSTGLVSPNLDATYRETNVSVKARLVGPTPYSPFLAPTETGPGLTTVVDVPGNTNTIFFIMANQDALPLEWSMELYDKPKLTQLSILSAQIVGTGSAAFSLVNSLPTVLDLGSSQQFMVNFTPPALGKYQAVLRLQTDAGAGFGQLGEVYEIQLHGTTGDFQSWAYNLPQGPRGANDDADGNGISNIIEYGLNGGGRGDLPKIISGSPSSQAQFSLPGTMRPDVFWSVDGSKDLGSWQRVANRNPATGLWSSSAPFGAVAEQLADGKRRVSLTMPGNEPKYFLRLVGDHVSNSYSNDFSAGAGATLRGPAVWDQESLRLSDGSPLGLGAAVMDGVSTWAGQTGFQATFQLQMDSGSYEAGNGVAFAVGDLGSGVWGDRGPATARNLTVLVETYYYLAPPPHPRGFEIVVNGVTVATDITPAFQSDQPETIQVTYTPATGVSVRYRGTPILTNVAVPGFALQAGDQYGFSAYRGENNHVSRVANVEIQPR